MTEHPALSLQKKKPKEPKPVRVFPKPLQIEQKIQEQADLSRQILDEIQELKASVTRLEKHYGDREALLKTQVEVTEAILALVLAQKGKI